VLDSLSQQFKRCGRQSSRRQRGACALWRDCLVETNGVSWCAPWPWLWRYHLPNFTCGSSYPHQTLTQRMICIRLTMATLPPAPVLMVIADDVGAGMSASVSLSSTPLPGRSHRHPLCVPSHGLLAPQHDSCGGRRCWRAAGSVTTREPSNPPSTHHPYSKASPPSSCAVSRTTHTATQQLRWALLLGV
jgi:hypothetical protein